MRNESWIILAQQKSELSYQTVVQFICQNLIVWFCSQKSSWSGMLSSRQTERHTFSKLDFNGQKRRRAHSDVTPLILTYFLSMTKSSTKLMGPINPDSALCHLLSDMFYETLLRIQGPASHLWDPDTRCRALPLEAQGKQEKGGQREWSIRQFISNNTEDNQTLLLACIGVASF